jgi:hypothetical protein
MSRINPECPSSATPDPLVTDEVILRQEPDEEEEEDEGDSKEDDDDDDKDEDGYSERASHYLFRWAKDTV